MRLLQAVWSHFQNLGPTGKRQRKSSILEMRHRDQVYWWGHHHHLHCMIILRWTEACLNTNIPESLSLGNPPIVFFQVTLRFCTVQNKYNTTRAVYVNLLQFTLFLQLGLKIVGVGMELGNVGRGVRVVHCVGSGWGGSRMGQGGGWGHNRKLHLVPSLFSCHTQWGDDEDFENFD